MMEAVRSNFCDTQAAPEEVRICILHCFFLYLKCWLNFLLKQEARSMIMSVCPTGIPIRSLLHNSL